MPVGDGLAREHRVRLHDVAAMGVLLDGVDEVLQERRPPVCIGAGAPPTSSPSQYFSIATRRPSLLPK
jgi:hypothetical protein